MFSYWVLFTIFVYNYNHGGCSDTRPNIVFILLDDLGFNDVSFLGSTGVKTPNITELAKEGAILTRHYTQSICSPSRGALMTSKYAMRLGLQRDYIEMATPWGVPLEEKFMPQYFKEMGYQCHAVGKWHLGFYKTDYLPTKRGFDSFYGFYGGNLDYFDHTKRIKDSSGSFIQGLDFRFDNQTHSEILQDVSGDYSTNLYAEQARKLIQLRDKSKPLFLYLSHQGVHAPLQGPKSLEDEFPQVSGQDRRTYLAQLLAVDNAVGVAVQTLKEEGIFDDTLIVFTSDNGGPLGAQSNYPLRGSKQFNFEGGVRTPTFIRGPSITSGKTYNNLFHLVDWLPTLFEAAGGDPNKLPDDLDGVSHWLDLGGSDSNSIHDPPRTEVLINVQGGSGQESAIISGNFKLHHAPDGMHSHKDSSWDQWTYYQGPQKDNDKFRTSQIDNWNIPVTYCNIPANYTSCHLTLGADKVCLFDIISDPCEYNNIASLHPDVVNMLMQKLDDYRKEMIPPFEQVEDPQSHPNGNYWRPWKGSDNLIEL